MDQIKTAVDLYRDDFLTGFTLSNCPDFDEWQCFQAEDLRQQLAKTLEEIIQSPAATFDPEAARERGCQREHWATVEELLQELADWGQHQSDLLQ